MFLQGDTDIVHTTYNNHNGAYMQMHLRDILALCTLNARATTKELLSLNKSNKKIPP